MASVSKRNGSYLIRVSNGADPSGKRIMHTCTFRPDKNLTPKQEKKALEKAVYEFEQKVLSGNLLDGERMTFGQLYEKWHVEYAAMELELTTLAGYEHNTETYILPAIGAVKLAELKPLHLQRLYNSLRRDDVRHDGKKGGLSDTTINMIHMTISSILRKAVEWEIIDHNVCDRIATPKRARNDDEVKFFTIEETRRFLEALDMKFPKHVKKRRRKDSSGKEYDVAPYTEYVTIPLQFKVLFHIAIFGGLRRGEIIALRWDDVDFDEKTISISKSAAYAKRKSIEKSPKTKASKRTIKMPDVVMELLLEYREQYEGKRNSLGTAWATDGEGNPLNYIFIQSEGKQMCLSTPLHRFKSILRQYNEMVENKEDALPIIPLHGLRHTSASLLISQGVDVRTVAGRLGHSQTSTTLNIYSHPLKSMDEVASSRLELALGRDEKSGRMGSGIHAQKYDVKP